MTGSLSAMSGVRQKEGRRKSDQQPKAIGGNKKHARNGNSSTVSQQGLVPQLRKRPESHSFVICEGWAGLWELHLSESGRRMPASVHLPTMAPALELSVTSNIHRNYLL